MVEEDLRCTYCGKSGAKKVTLKVVDSGIMQEIPYTHVDKEGNYCRFDKVNLCTRHLEMFSQDVSD